MPIAEKVAHWGFRRGFVEELRITLQQWRAHLGAALAAAPIRCVHLQRLSTLPGPATIREVAEDALLGRLAELDLKNARLQNLELTTLAGSPHLAGLRALGLKDNPLGPEGLRHLGQARGLGRLERLNMALTPTEVALPPLDAPLLTALAEADWFGRLTDLDLGYRALSAALVRRLFGRPLRLRHLRLAGCDLHGDAAAALAECPGLAGLASLDLSNNPIGARGTQALAGSPHLARLRSLSLRGVSPGQAGVRALAESTALAGLHHLDLGSNAQLTEKALAPLATAPHWKGLISLGLEGLKVTPALRASLRERFPGDCCVFDYGFYFRLPDFG